MATGRSMQLTKQIGEYLVAAELCRRGFVAATFSGNVPHYDILASNEKGDKYAIQVKSILSKSWQFDASKFVKISMQGKKQVIDKKIKEPYPNLICVFVVLKDYGEDEFYILSWKILQNKIIHFHKSWLKRHGGIRPNKPNSFHTAISPKQIKYYKDNWDLIK